MWCCLVVKPINAVAGLELQDTCSLFSLVVLVGCQLINAVAGLTLQAVVLLNLLVPLQGWDARFGVVKLKNDVAGWD